MRDIRTGLTIAAVVALTFVAQASTPRFWHVSTQADFLKGEVENLSIDGDGRLVLGPAAELVYESGAPFLWTLAPAPDGGFWAGSGNEGKVFHIDNKGQARTFFDAPELEVHALAPASDGGLFVGTSPDGKIYKLAADGSSSTFFDPDDKYIWALAVATDGTVYAGTGDKGTIYKIDKTGSGAPLYRTQATHVTALVIEAGGSLVAGTESPGRVFRVGPKGEAFVLLDSEFREIHALRLSDKGVIYAAAISGKDSLDDRSPDRPAMEPQRTEPIPTVSTEITTISIGDVQVGSSPSTPSSRPQPRDLKGAIYRIAPDGLWDVVWESVEDSPYDVMFDGSGRVIIGTGGKGKLFRVGDDPASAMLLTRAAAQQMTMFLNGKDGATYYATANPGKVFKLSAGRMEKGVYLSEIRDASTVATWGSIRWRATTPAGAQLQLFTRSGNTARPDETWSAWSPAYRTASGEQISSPKARYLQWKAEFSGSTASPILTSVTAAYLERNLRPVVESITVHPPGAAFQKPFSTGELELAGYDEAPPDSRLASAAAAASNIAPAPQLGRRVYQKGLQTFVWKASDDNDDRLQFDVLYRGEGESDWKVLKRALTDPVLVWDTSSVPDGTYVVKVVASDSPSNSPGTALSGELESTAFDIDNTPPIIKVTGIRRDGERSVAAFIVEDLQSPVQRVEYSLDANRWRVIYPKDGIPDSRLEEFEVVLDGEAAGRSPTIRATDAMSNAATAVAEAKPAAAK